MNATPLSKLPPPMVQSRRPEAPQTLSPGGPSDGGRKSKDVSAPTYAELLREMDAAGPPAQEAYESYEDAYDQGYQQPAYQQPHEYEPPRQQARQQPQKPRAPPSDEAIPPRPPAPVSRGGLVWRHRSTILVAIIVMVMLMYGVPKLQTAAPSLFSPMTMYKLNVTGAAVVAASAAGIHATLSTYVL